MKRWLIPFIVLLSSSAFAQSPPEIPYNSVQNLLKLPPDMHLGEVAGVAVNSKGHIFVYSRGGSSQGPAFGNTASQVLEFDNNGTFLREIGKNLYAWAYAHTVRIDKDDNIWATDKGSDMVIKFNPQGRVEMVFGRKSEASDAEAHPHERNKTPPLPHVDGRFRQPTDVTWGPNGEIYISDGYVNSRVAKLDKDGEWIKSWGQRGKGPGEFNLVHSIAADAQGNIYVGDRNNRRIQVFDGDGNFRREMKIDVPFDDDAKPAIGNKPDLTNYLQTGGSFAPGAPWAICITPPPNQVLFASDSYPGRIYKLSLDGRVLGYLGKSGKQLKQFGWIHEIACPSENELYVAEILNWRVQKLSCVRSSNARRPADVAAFLCPHAEEAAKPPSRSMAASSARAAILRDAAFRRLLRMRSESAPATNDHARKASHENRQVRRLPRRRRLGHLFVPEDHHRRRHRRLVGVQREPPPRHDANHPRARRIADRARTRATSGGSTRRSTPPRARPQAGCTLTPSRRSRTPASTSRARRSACRSTTCSAARCATACRSTGRAAACCGRAAPTCSTAR